MKKLSKCGKYEIYLDEEYGYIAIKGLGTTYGLEFDEWDKFITVLKIADCKIKGAMLDANRN